LSIKRLEQTASKVCGGVKTEQESQSVQSCFNSLLYTAATSNSNSQRTQTSEETAIQACAIARDAPPSNPGVILVPVQTKPTRPPEAVVNCMRQLLYTRKLVCTRTGFPRCSSIPQEGFAGWQTQDVRTDVSEDAATQACS
jgi:hypothetical protein